MSENTIMGTIEVMTDILARKIDALLHLIAAVQDKIPAKIQDRVHSFVKDYELGCTKILTEYFEYRESQVVGAPPSREGKAQILRQRERYRDEFQKFLTSECIFPRMRELFDELSPYLGGDVSSGAEDDLDDFLFAGYSTDVERCERCNGRMEIEQNQSLMQCKAPDCGVSFRLKGVLFEDDYYYVHDGKRSKHCNYDPSKHCKMWLERIQAREPVEIPVSIIDRTRDCVYRDGIVNKEDITCERIRKYLRQMNQAVYYNHVPLIRKILSGIEPPSMTDEEQHQVISYFNRIARIYDLIKSDSNPNLRYHPYFIYKIIEHLLQGEEHRRRRQDILACIHLQSRETLIEHDRIWKQICSHIPEFEYCPTYRVQRLPPA